MATNNYPTLTIIKRLIGEARGYRLHLLAIFLLSFLNAPLVLLNPVPLKIVIDNVIGSQAVPNYIDIFLPSYVSESGSHLLIVAALLMVCTELLKGALSVGMQYLRAYTGQNMVVAFRARLFKHAQSLSLSYHDELGSTDSTYRILNDASSINQVLIGAGVPLLRAWFPLIGMVVVMGLLDWELTLIALIVIPIQIFLVRVYGWRLKSKWKAVKQLDSSAMSIIQESLTSLRVVKAFSTEQQEEDRFLNKSNQRVKSHLGAVLTSATYHLFVGLAITVVTAVVLYVGAKHVQSEILTIGELLMVMTYLGQLFGPISAMTNAAAGMANGLAGAERALQLLDQTSNIVDRPDALPVKRVQGKVEFRDVTFGYTPDTLALENISFMVEPGARVAIQGETGAGKTTLVNLLMRLYEVESGKILVDGQDIRNYRLRDYRDQFAIVLQEPVLFSATIAENIRYGRASASLDEIKQAAELANAHGFISRLENGYDTEVGERGAKLSGGERQRISCARAFLRDAPILILDEPTSSVDLQTEFEMIEAFDRLQKGRTAFIISHRDSTLEGCTQIVRLHKGRLIDG